MNHDGLLRKHCLRWNQDDRMHDSGQQNISEARNGRNCHLRVGVFPNEVYVSSDTAATTTTTTTTTYVCTIQRRLLELLMTNFGCTLHFRVASVNAGGRRLSNGSWTGILALFEQRQIDLIPKVFNTANNRAAIVQFVFLMPQAPLLNIFSCIKALPSSSSSESHWWWSSALVHSFSSAVWILILGSLVTFSVLHWLSRSNNCNSGKRVTLLSSLIDHFGAFLGQPVKCSGPNNQRYQIRHNPQILWILTAFVLRQLLATDITARLLASGQLRFDYFSQLMMDNNYSKGVQLLIENGSSTYDLFRERYPPLMRRTVNITFAENSGHETLRKLIQEHYVLITPRQRVELIRNYYYPRIPFHISQEGFLPSLGNYPMGKYVSGAKRSLLTRVFKSLYWFGLESRVDQTVEMGNFKNALKASTEQENQHSIESLESYLHRWHRRQDARDASSNSDGGQALSQQMAPLLTLYAAGIAAATVAFGLELLVLQLS